MKSERPARSFRPLRVGAGFAVAVLVFGGTVAIVGRSHAPATGTARGSAPGLAARATSPRAGADGSVAPAGRGSVAARLLSMVKALENGASLPADCVPHPSGPPGSPYQLGVIGRVQNGVLTAGTATVADINAMFCGVVTVVAGTPPCGATGTVSSPKDGQIFGSIFATLNLIPGMTPKVPFVAHPGTISGGFACQPPSPQGLEVSLTAVVSGSTGIFGLSCTIGPLTIPLSGVLTGPLKDLSITLTSHDFAVPAVTASPTCAGQVPTSLDTIAGLPIPAGGATATLPVTAALYQPPPPSH